jgi:Domain of unknown function (DUF4345)
MGLLIHRGPMTRGLRVLWTILGVVAVVFGTVTVLTGGGLVPGVVDLPASVDSELRFYGAWYVGAGVVVLRSVRRIESEGRVVRAVCAILLLAALGRALSMIFVGRPHALYVVLLIIEVAIPVVVLPWQAVAARRAIRA